MNPEIQKLIAAYRGGQIGPDVFLKQMSAMGFDQAAATKLLIDDEVAQKNAPSSSPQGFSTNLPGPGQTAPMQQSQPQAQVQPQVRTESGTMVTPGYSLGPRFQLKDPEGQTIPPAPYQVSRFEESGSPYVGSPYSQAGDAQRFRPQYDPGQAQRFRPEGETVQNAISLAKRTASPQMASAQTPDSGPSDLLHTLIRGRFGDAARGNPMDDRLTAFQEARDKSGDSRASGGAVNGKEAALHKALEIIHHLIRTR